jgi:hypothetical protein
MKCDKCGCEMEEKDESMDSEALDEILGDKEESKPKGKKLLDLEIIKLAPKKK